MSTAMAPAPAPTLRARLGALGMRCLGLVGLVAALAAWQLLAARADSNLVPTFSETVDALGTLIEGGAIGDDVVPSLWRYGIGFVLSGLLGVAIGSSLARFRFWHDLAAPVVDFGRSVPGALLVPLSIALFGLGTRTVVAVIVVSAVWPVILSTFDGVRRVDPVLTDTARTMSMSGVERWRRVTLRAALGEILGGLRVALSISLAVGVVAEMLGATDGIGFLIRNSQQQFAINNTYAGVLMLAIIGLAADTLFLFIERRLLHSTRQAARRS